jgi:outer membrane lipoprotein SlyB
MKTILCGAALITLSHAALAQQPAAGTAGPPSVKQAIKAATCPECGTVQGVAQIKKKGDASGVGAVAGGVVGGVAGKKLADSNTGMVVGAAGGAVAGHMIEKQIKKTKVWEVTVKMDDGSIRKSEYKDKPPFEVSQRVEYKAGVLAKRS